ncbi:hypothetical protein ACJRO7_000169 [Eucalyptus globulus]|uniref:PGG domain-containing protein n=1 Tax=Eucalyptus globulus TaxID=34317 RepID=A0ABD3LSE9_EUCGL
MSNIQEMRYAVAPDGPPPLLLPNVNSTASSSATTKHRSEKEIWMRVMTHRMSLEKRLSLHPRLQHPAGARSLTPATQQHPAGALSEQVLFSTSSVAGNVLLIAINMMGIMATIYVSKHNPKCRIRYAAYVFHFMVCITIIVLLFGVFGHNEFIQRASLYTAIIALVALMVFITTALLSW